MNFKWAFNDGKGHLDEKVILYCIVLYYGDESQTTNMIML